MLRNCSGCSCRSRQIWQQAWLGSRRTASRHLSTPALPRDFAFYPNFFTEHEQRVLLSAALRKLDAMESGRLRRRRREFLRSSGLQANGNPDAANNTVQSLFLPDDLYDFQEGHFDGVIRRYREMHVTSWPEDMPEVPSILERLRSVHPDEDTQTHILHLSSDGEILPHVDNLEASGSWILGISLGDERMLRLENPSSPGERYELPLPSGSVYIQRQGTSSL
ncbi:hypothetical protein BD413DRAFT_499818 [Trametes elegans]|nr:hypothetical protein BD413DRAFT_499818 [Trametes elegans]